MYAYSQNGDHNNGGRFLKRIEYNNGGNNLDSKMSGEKRLLDKFNAPVEFYYASLGEIPEGPWAFRIVRDTSAKVFSLIYTTYKNPEALDVNGEIVSRSFTVSDEFAEKMYVKMTSLIENFKAKVRRDDEYVSLILGGIIVTFRTVVEDEVWSLYIHVPSGNSLKMSDLCRQILDDAKGEKLNEAKYIKVLDGFDFAK